jgi:hypothetical protein
VAFRCETGAELMRPFYGYCGHMPVVVGGAQVRYDPGAPASVIMCDGSEQHSVPAPQGGLHAEADMSAPPELVPSSQAASSATTSSVLMSPAYLKWLSAVFQTSLL